MTNFLLFLSPIREEQAMYGAMPDVWDCKFVNINDKMWRTEIRNWCKQRNIETSALMVKELEFSGFSFYSEEDW